MTPSFTGAVGGPSGAGGGGLPCLGSPPCLPRAGTKAGLIAVALSIEGVAPILRRLASACRGPDAIPGVPLRAGAGLLACRGYRGSGGAPDWGTHGVQAQWRPSPGAVAPSGWGGGAPLVRRGGWRPLCRPPAVRGLGGGGGGEGESRRGSPLSPFGSRCSPAVAAGGWLDGPGPGPPCGCLLRGVIRCWGEGGEVGRGGGPRFWGCTPGGGVLWAANPLSSLAPLPATGRRAVVRALTHDPPAPPVSVASSRGTGGGKRGGTGGRWGRRSGLTVSG